MASRWALATVALLPLAQSWMTLVGYQVAGNTLTSVYELRADGTLLSLVDVPLGTSATWMVWSGSTLYAGVDSSVVSATLNVSTRGLSTPTGVCFLNTTAATNTPVHIALHPDGSSIVSVSYGSGNIAVCPIDPITRAIVPGAPRSQAFIGPNAHEVVFAPRPAGAGNATPANFFVPTLGDDRVLYGTTAPSLGDVVVRNDSVFFPGAAEGVPPGPQRMWARGPRHIVFHPLNTTWAYVLNELNNTIAMLRHDPTLGVLTNPTFISTLRPGFPASDASVTNVWVQQAAEIIIHPNGRVLYASNRGTTSTPPIVRGYAPADADNSIAVFSISPLDGTLTLVYHETGGGAIHFPRHFALSPDGLFMLVANQRGDSITSFSVQNDGLTLSKIQTVLTGANSAPAFVAILPEAVPPPPPPAGPNVSNPMRTMTIGFSVLGSMLALSMCVLGIHISRGGGYKSVNTGLRVDSNSGVVVVQNAYAAAP